MTSFYSTPPRLHDICRRLQDDEVEQLDLCGQNMGLNGAMSLSVGMKQNNSLRVLNLSYNLIPPNGAVLLIKSIPKSVQVLDLRDNGIGNDGAKAIADMITSTHDMSLSTVLLRNNGIGPQGAMDLGRSLSLCPTLRKLDMGRNLIGNHGARAIAYMIKTNKTLLSLSLWNNGIDSEGIFYIADALKHNESLQSLLVGGNYISDDGAEKLAAALCKNHHLKQLNIGSGQIGEHGAVALANMLKDNTTLVEIDLFHNPIGTTGAKAFYDVLRTRNVTLLEMHVDYQRDKNCRDGKVNQAILSYVALNRAGRGKMSDINLHWGFWPKILEKVANKSQLLYLVLQEKPELMQEQATCAGLCLPFERFEVTE